MNDMNNPVSKRNGHAQTARTNAWDPDRDPLEAIVAEFTDRFRNGDRVTVEEYARRYPDFASEIRELFPAVSAMERLNCKRMGHASLAANSPPAGQLGDYRIIGEIARGGMGVVYEAEQVTLGRRVAMKILPRQALRSQRDVQRFHREAQTAAKLHHTNIVPVFGVGEQEGTHYIVMQLIRGVGLDEVITELKRVVTNRRDGQPAQDLHTARSSRIKRSAVTLLQETLRRDSATVSLEGGSPSAVSDYEPRPGIDHGKTDVQTVPEVLHISSSVGSEYYRNVARIGLQAAQALSYAHRHGTLHRDVKPGNLLLDEEGVVWIADFGLAKAIEQDNVTWTGDLVGTLAYMAPERFEGSATALSDVYSLGLTLYELLTFERAYDGSDRVTVMRRVTNDALPPPRKLNSAVPRDLETIVLKAAARNPQDRYRTAGELASDLENFLHDRPIAARRVTQVELFVRWCRHNRMVASLAASVMFLLATVLGVTMAGYVHATAQHRQKEFNYQLAISALDGIYGQFAPAQLNIPSSSNSADEDEEKALLGSTQPPLTKGVAILLEDLLEFYDKLSKQSDDTDRVAIKSVVANRKVGDIRRRLGDFEKSRDSYVQTIERIEGLDSATRDSQTVRLEYARTQNGLGIVLDELRLFDKVGDSHREAIRRLDSASSSPIERFELARSLYLLHLAQPRSKHRGASDIGYLDRAVDILDELRTTHPNGPDYRFLLARCFLAYPTGCNSDGTLSPFQTQAIEILDELVEASPDVADYRYELGDAYRAIEWREHRRRGDDERPPEELAQSESRLRRALEVTANLETVHPNIPQYYALKKCLHHILASVLEDEQKFPDAEYHYNQAIEKQRQLIKQSNEPNKQRVWLHHVQLDHARLLRDLGRGREIRKDLEAIVAGLEKLLNLAEIKEHRFYGRRTERYLAQAYATLTSVLLAEEECVDSILRKAERCH